MSEFYLALGQAEFHDVHDHAGRTRTAIVSLSTYSLQAMVTLNGEP